MSYTEYLRRKDAAMVKVQDTRENTDASMYTTKVRMASSTDFPVNGQQIGAVSHTDLTNSPNYQVMSYQKTSGGRVKDASSFTQYRGGQAVGGYAQSGGKAAQVTLGVCYTITPTTPAQTASSWVTQRLGCLQANGQPHAAATVDKPKFVDTTIINLGDPALCTVPVPNHNIKAEVPHNLYSARPVLPNKGNLEPGKEVGAFGGNPHYKPGAAVRRPQNYQIFKEDTNVGTTTTRPVPTKYRIPSNSPAHLKINSPIGSLIGH
jgi:hypothetical protein